MRGRDLNLHLLRAALDAQAWDSVDDVPDADRYVRALNGTEPLTVEEKRQLWLSPTARENFSDAREFVRLDLLQLWRTRDFETKARRLAAASGSASSDVVGTRDFRVAIQRDDTDPTRPEWLLRLTVEPRIKDTLDAGGFGLLLRDTGGMIWLEGIPDDDRELSGLWEHHGSPLDRLKDHSLQLSIS